MAACNKVMLTMIAGVLLALPAGSVRAQQAQLDDILRAVHERQAAVSTVDVSWRQERFLPETVKGIEACRLAIEGDRARIERQPEPADLYAKLRGLFPLIAVLEGQEERSIVEGSYAAAGKPDVKRGFIVARSHAMHVFNVDCFPIWLAYRLYEPGSTPHETGASPTVERREGCGGHVCIVLRHQVPDDPVGGTANVYIWLAEDMGYRPLRWRSEYRYGAQVREISIQYARGANNDWQPTGWRIEGYDRGVMTYACSSQVTCLKANEEFSLDTLHLEFPGGMLVQDDVRGRSYIVGPNGTELPSQ